MGFTCPIESMPNLCAVANPAGASRLQSTRPERRVAELGSLGIMARRYSAVVVGCLLQAAVPTALQLLFFYQLRGLSFAVYVLFSVSWPLWGIPLWMASRSRRATVFPMLCGLVLLSPVIILWGALLFGANVFPVPQ